MTLWVARALVATIILGLVGMVYFVSAIVVTLNTPGECPRNDRGFCEAPE